MKKLPIGIENFKRLIDDDYYYIDKTMFIRDVLNETNILFTRPRRFGKTLNMNMLYYFFSNKEKENAYLFNGLEISKDFEAMKHQNQYPVISLTLKDMKAMNFEDQVTKFASLISELMKKNLDVFDATMEISDAHILDRYKDRCASYIELEESLLLISKCMEHKHHEKVIILIDEYDVPLQSAYQNGYYDEMVIFLRNVFSNALKTNDYLEKGILTGCLRVSKESIFTGLNNFNVYGITNYFSSTRFGFTQEETYQLLKDYHFEEYFDEVKEWYDGYLFGETEIYNPWSVLKYVLKATQEPAKPESFWANTSSNDIIYKYIKEGNATLHEEFEMLIQGNSVTKRIKPELTYRDMDDINNIYSFLLLTGYLKIHKKINEYEYELVIPNKEVYEIYNQTFMDYFQEYTGNIKGDFIEALQKEETKKAKSLLNDMLQMSISYYDNNESFYHGFLVGLFQGYIVESNKESGNGRFDIAILPKRLDRVAVIIECKHSKTIDDLFEDSEKAANQIHEKNYFNERKFKNYDDVCGYGISFFEKQCYITKA